jgi:phosphate transport system substrate-binding protein
VTAVAGLLCVVAATAAEPTAPPATLQGILKSVGSDTMEPMINAWANAFARAHPRVRFDIDARGSGTAAEALIGGTSQLAPMSREMTAGEKSNFEGKYGYLPTQIKVALDAVAVYVDRNNPVDQLTLEQLDGIFSQSQECGGRKLTFWNELGRGFASNTRIEVVGRDLLSGTYEFFREHALCDGSFRGDYQGKSDSNHVIYEIATNRNAIGYAGIGYRTRSVKIVSLARTSAGPYVKVQTSPGEIDVNVISSGRYPLARFVNIYVNKAPGTKLPPLIDQFLRFVLSKEGQDLVERAYFVRIGDATANAELSKLRAEYAPSWLD